ncbi:MAG: hypothetical protein ACXACI_05460 [Candidatus Hodarchaeales archaeon]|jgi:hypothetical protein
MVTFDEVGGTWNVPFTEGRGVFSAELGSLVNLTITKAQVQNYSSSYWGLLEFGNLSLNVDNAESGLGLTLSVYPWLPGLVTHTNWTWHRNMAEEAALGGFQKGNLSISEIGYKIFAVQRMATVFEYAQDKTTGNQNTTLVYDIETGVLLHAYTEISFGILFSMSLELRHAPEELHENNILQTSNSTEETSLGFMGFLFLWSIISIGTIATFRGRKLR